ncbi:MAG: hypothetical protein ABSH34_20120 [Verrucomicrobiota bacterium]|jgi:hypothetical protein
MFAAGGPRFYGIDNAHWRAVTSLKMGTERPLGIALVICDRVIVDATTHEKTLVASFNRIRAQFFPAMHPRMSFFISVTNGRGTMQGRIRCINESDQKPVFSASGPLIFKDPLHVVEMTFQVRNAVFPNPGVYNVEFLCDDDIILQRRFQVAQMESKTE